MSFIVLIPVFIVGKVDGEQEGYPSCEFISNEILYCCKYNIGGVREILFKRLVKDCYISSKVNDSKKTTNEV